MLSADITLNMEYEAPKSEEVGVDFQTNYGQWAVAINGEIIAKSEQNLEMRPTASTAKMILALAVMEKKPFEIGEKGENIVITQEMYDRYVWYLANNGSNSAVILGEEISEYDALAATLIVSSNNMADSLAIWAFGSLEEYHDYAIEMLERTGLAHTKIGPDASGYNKNTISTAEDLAKIGELVLKQPVLAEIVARTEISVPVAGELKNTNKLLGELGIIGVKTGYIGDASGYCLVSGYKTGESIVTVALLGAPTRASSFDDSKSLVQTFQSHFGVDMVVTEGDEVGYYESWWAGRVPIIATQNRKDLIYGDFVAKLEMSGAEGELVVSSDYNNYIVPVVSEEFPAEPSLWQRFLRVFGWEYKK